MYKISRENGSYHAVEVDIYQGVREAPVSKLIYNYPSIRIEQQAIGFTYDATLNPKTMEMSGTWKQGEVSGPFTMKLNALPDAFPEPMAESDYAPRKDSDLQGYWKGTLKVGNHTAAGGPQNCRTGGWHLSGDGRQSGPRLERCRSHVRYLPSADGED